MVHGSCGTSRPIAAANCSQRETLWSSQEFTRLKTLSAKFRCQRVEQPIVHATCSLYFETKDCHTPPGIFMPFASEVSMNQRTVFSGLALVVVLMALMLAVNILRQPPPVLAQGPEKTVRWFMETSDAKGIN